MTRSILVGLAILTLSTSGASAWSHRTHHYHHSQAMNAYGSVAAPPAYGGVAASPFVGMGGASSSDHAMYLRNLHDSGYNPRNNFNANGTMATQ
jgi:hypothetical protein